jgi:branched-chain amino acid transport system substrate-binding protein
MSGLAACGSSDSGSGESSGGLPKTIKVGVVTQKTGNFAGVGSQYLAGIQMAADEINDSDLLGGSKIELEVGDSASDPATATSETAKLVRTDIVALLAYPTSNEALAAAPVAQQAGVPTLVNCAPDGLLDIGENIFSMAQVFNSSVPLLAETIATAGYQTASIISSNDIPTLVDYGQKLKDELGKNGVEVTASVETPNAATDFSGVVSKAMDGSPDVIVLNTASVGVLQIVQALRTAGYDGPLVGSPAAPSGLTNAPAVANGIKFPTEWVPGVDNQASKDFEAKFEKKYPGEVPTYENVDGYDAMQFLAQAILKAGKADRKAILDGLNQMTKAGFSGPTGDITFTGDGNRQFVTDNVLAEVQDGKFVLATN